MRASPLPLESVSDVSDKVAGALTSELEQVQERVLDSLRDALEGIRVPVPEPEIKTPAPLGRACTGIREGKGQVAVLRSLLAGASSLGARAALFVLRSDAAEMWESSGFEEDESRNGSLQGTRIDREQEAVAAVVIDRKPVYIRNGAPLATPDFGQAPRSECCVLPIRVQDRVVAILYCDRADEESVLDRSGLEVLVEVAGLAVERLALARALVPAGVGRASGPVPTMNAASRAAVAAPSFSQPTGPVGMPSAPPPVLVEEISDEGFELMPEPEDLAGDSPSSPEIEDARRFARLLIEEICLYHPDEVDAGRSKRDLHDRLRDEIERARKMYEQRVASDVRSKGDFFGEALVKVLAAGDAAALA